jgi:MFS family permease
MSAPQQALLADETQRTADKAGWLVASVGSVVGLAIMGDSLMYSILPLAASSLGIALPAVGVLLSANRLIRLFSNAWAGRVFERIGPRLPFLISVMIGVVATVIYGIGAGFVLFLAARLLWGVAWSGLRQGGYQAVWTGLPAMKGRLTGLLWGLVRLGSAFSVLVGGFLFDRYGYHAAVGMAIAAAVAGLLLALTVQWPRQVTHAAPVRADGPQPAADRETSAWRTMWRAPVQRWLTVAGFFDYLLSGIVVSTTALFLAVKLGVDAGLAQWGIGVATVTGLLHGMRWISDLALGPLVGAVSDRIGQDNAAVGVGAVLGAALLGAVSLPPLGAVGCLLLVLLCDGALHIVMSAAASGAALTNSRPHAFIGVFTTATDAGSALGPLVAYSVATWLGFPLLYLGAGALLALALSQYWRVSRSQRRIA